MQVVKCQTKIITIIGQVKAIVTGVCIRGENITYEISYFREGIYTTAWIHRYEFEIDYVEPKKAGLVNYDIETKESENIILLT